MWPDQVSNPGPLTNESGALPTALHGPATTVGERQECLLSLTLFNIFLERIMSDALEEHEVKVSIGDRNITSLWFAAT